MSGWQTIALILGVIWAPVALFCGAMLSTAHDKRVELEKARIEFWDRWLSDPPMPLTEMAQQLGVGQVKQL